MKDLGRLIWYTLIGLFRSRCTGSRNPRAPASAQCPAAQLPEASGAQWRGPAGDVDPRHRAGVPSLLASEVPAARWSAMTPVEIRRLIREVFQTSGQTLTTPRVKQQKCRWSGPSD